MKTKIYYSIVNAGDGSAYAQFMESKELCEIDQHFQNDGWAEDSWGWITIESSSPISIVDEVVTVEMVKKELEEELAYLEEEYGNTNKYPGWFARVKGHLEVLTKLVNGEEYNLESYEWRRLD